MKKHLFSLALLFGLSSSIVGTSFAADLRQDDGRQRRQGREQRQDRRQDHDRRGKFSAQERQRRTDELAKELDLSKKQKSKIEKIFQDQQQQMQALRGRSGQDRGQQMSEFKRIRENTDKQLKDALSKKQYAQLEAKRQERMRQMSNRRDRQQDHQGTDRRGFGGRS
ncbi:hypothetical protein [Hymenobacter sp. DG01]|uniref:hypothetical protein n=1 Tax=Hymenobacter sp. DG01 TaxID=2584940 RepID=UPI0011245544|nr:hypothetical protein [Hymenobacter sp. DG01]